MQPKAGSGAQPAATSAAGGASTAGAGAASAAPAVAGASAPQLAAAAGSAGGALTMAGNAGVSGSAGAAGAAANSMFKRGCVVGDLGPCGSFTTNDKELELGPYGAVMDRNVGKGFEYTVASGDADNNASCKSFADSFGENPKNTEALLDTGDLSFTLYTVYRPAVPREGEKYPLITWGNGTCAQPEGYAALLRYVASHGYYVVAPNSRWVGSGAEMRKGIDFLVAANGDPKSPYYGKIDTSKVGAMGHSQGGQGTVAALSDSRINAAIIWNADRSASKPFLAVSGDSDITGSTPANMASSVKSSSTKGAFLYYHMVPMTGSASGHLTLMTQPERVAEPAVAWWRLILQGDAESKKFFVGTDCKLCNQKDAFEFGQKGLE
jgi:hypothetical protein